jgi:hypothetical protein
LTTDSTSRADSSRVFARATVHDCVDGNLDGVLVSHYVDLVVYVSSWLCGCGWVTYDLERVCNNADGHEFLSVIAAVHHERVGKTFDDRALCLSESLLCVSASGVGDVDWGADLDVVAAKGIVSQDFADCPILPIFAITFIS